MQAEPAFQKGWFEVQDEGSQIAAELAGATPGMQVLDFCAGAGGKTLALSAAMENRGQIFAHDSDKSRHRADLRPHQALGKPQRPGGDQAAANWPGWPATWTSSLVDAPCTGSGTWRRRPDAKWRLTRAPARRAARRAGGDPRSDAARFVKPGGRLVYITCSVFAEENQPADRGIPAGATRHLRRSTMPPCSRRVSRASRLLARIEADAA